MKKKEMTGAKPKEGKIKRKKTTSESGGGSAEGPVKKIKSENGEPGVKKKKLKTPKKKDVQVDSKDNVKGYSIFKT